MIEPQNRGDRSSHLAARFMLYAAASADPQSGSKCVETPRMCEPVRTAKSTEWRSRRSLIRSSDSWPHMAAWFSRSFDAPTDAQVSAWPALQRGRHVLVAAPTGSGKTFAAFLAAIDQLVKEGLQAPLPDETRVLYVSPLKALSNDIQRNLEAPLNGIREELAALGLPDVEIRAVVRTGDTSASERAGMRRRAPHIVVTTPESLYILLGSQSGRDMLSTCRTVIVDARARSVRLPFAVSDPATFLGAGVRIDS